jgi:hypothetical protein
VKQGDSAAEAGGSEPGNPAKSQPGDTPERAATVAEGAEPIVDPFAESAHAVGERASQAADARAAAKGMGAERPEGSGDVTLEAVPADDRLLDEMQIASAPDPVDRVPFEAKKPRSRKSEVASEGVLLRSGEAPREPHSASGTGGDPVILAVAERTDDSANSNSSDRVENVYQPANAPGLSSLPREPDNSLPAPSARFAQHLLAASDDERKRAGAAGDVDQSRFVDRVARAFRAAENRQGVVKLRLHPPELGSLRIELRVQQGALTARLEAETAAAQSLLIDHAQILRDRLAEQGVRIERFDVNLLDQRTPSDQGGTLEQHASRDGSAPRPVRRPAPSSPSAGEPGTATRPIPSPGRLNVII